MVPRQALYVRIPSITYCCIHIEQEQVLVRELRVVTESLDLINMPIEFVWNTEENLKSSDVLFCQKPLYNSAVCWTIQ